MSGNLSVPSRDGTRIAYDSAGLGPALILVGGAFRYRGWNGRTELAQLLAPRFTVIGYDRRGRGDSGDAPEYAVEREIEDLDALVAPWAGRAGGALRAARERRAGIHRRAPAPAGTPAGGADPAAIEVLELEGDRVRTITAFADSEALYPRFGRPSELRA
ncbi:MAG TPA: hypothetical protein VHR46_10670 [Gaiella sp.]|nr:hypothetical protein [Gaiella sp.]